LSRDFHNRFLKRFHKTMLYEFYRAAFRRNIYGGLKELQRDLDAWLREYNELCPPSGPLVLWQDSAAKRSSTACYTIGPEEAVDPARVSAPAVCRGPTSTSHP
jgi:hypothetical protein